MSRKSSDPSPIRSGLLHGVASMAMFGGIAALCVAVGGWATADRSTGPQVRLALFAPVDGEEPPHLKAQLRTSAAEAAPASYSAPPATARPTSEPQLDVPPIAPQEQSFRVSPAAEASVIRINGKPVAQGESYAQATDGIKLVSAPIASLRERTRYGWMPRISDSGETSATAYARPFEGDTDTPTVSIIVGGLGINRTLTQSAIKELPPEITLSFVPHASNLNGLIRQARNAGHEVLIELPMEAYEPGRARAHPNTLRLGADTDRLTANTSKLLASATGYFGVTNYQGAKFASDAAMTEPFLELLRSRGVAFVEDGSLPSATFEASARETGASYAKADFVLDAQAEIGAIESQLLALETAARRDGQALGAGFAYPVTIDKLKDWSEQLSAKGLALAPASTHISAASTPSQGSALE